MKKRHEHRAEDSTQPGRVQQIRQNFLVHSDFGLAHRLQQEEFAVHYDRNRTQRRESGLGVKTARVVEEEEKQTFLDKQFDLYRQKQILEEKDIALAQRIERETKDRGNHRHSSEDTTSDEHLARILQEQEEEALYRLSKEESRPVRTYL